MSNDPKNTAGMSVYPHNNIAANAMPAAGHRREVHTGLVKSMGMVINRATFPAIK